jgi:excisionase family DNA binding protein
MEKNLSTQAHSTTTRCSIADTSTAQDTLTVAELSVMLRIHPVTVRIKAAAGEIPGRQIGNRWRFSRARIEAWLAQAA